MTHEEFIAWLRVEVNEGRMSVQQMHDLLNQKALFDVYRTDIETQFRNYIVGYIGDTRQESRNIHELLNRAKTQFPNRMLYFEAIGFDLF